MRKRTGIIRQGFVVALASAAAFVWGLWVAARIFPMHFSSIGRQAYHVIHLYDGGCWYQYMTPSTYSDGRSPLREYHWGLRRLGLQVGWDYWRRKEFCRLDFCFGLLPLAIILGVYPCIALLRGPVRRDIRRRHGRCPWCGYDLTGNTCGRCPECGKTVVFRTRNRIEDPP